MSDIYAQLDTDIPGFISQWCIYFYYKLYNLRKERKSFIITLCLISMVILFLENGGRYVRGIAGLKDDVGVGFTLMLFQISSIAIVDYIFYVRVKPFSDKRLLLLSVCVIEVILRGIFVILANCVLRLPKIGYPAEGILNYDNRELFDSLANIIGMCYDICISGLFIIHVNRQRREDQKMTTFSGM